MPNKTENFQLNQWEPEDNFLRTDFNEDNAKIETALTRLSSMVKVGTYTGDDAATQTIELGFQPSAVLVCESSTMGVMGGTLLFIYGGLAMPGLPVTNGGHTALAVTETGFTAHNISGYDYIRTNRSGTTYRYIAFQ